MSSDKTISFLLPDGNPYIYSIKNNEEVYYRNIAKELILEIPEEFIALYDLKLKRVISKYFDKLETTSIYKVFSMSLAVTQIFNKEQEITKQKIEIDKLKQNESLNINNQPNININRLEVRLNEVEKELQVAKDKVQEQRKDLESAQYDLKLINDQQAMYKQDMIKKLQEKDIVCDGYAQQCQRYVNDIESLSNQLQQSRQSIFQVQEYFQQYQQWKQAILQQLQLYSVQLESDRKNVQLEKYSVDAEVRRLKKKIQQQEDDFESKISDIAYMERQKASLNQQITSLKNELIEEQEKFTELQKKYQQEILTKYREINKKNQDLSLQQENLENITEKYTNLLKEFQDLQDKQNQQNENKGQVISEDIKSLQQQLNQQKELNEKLQKKNEDLQKKINNLQASLDESQLQITELQGIIQISEQKLKSCQDLSKQDLNSKQQKIEQQIEQNKQLEQQLNINKENLEELIQKHEEDSKGWKEKEFNYENENQSLKQILEYTMNEKKQSEEDFNKQRQELLNQLKDCEAQIFQKGFELIALQNSAIVPVYQFRIQKLVELVPREYNKDIEFAIETMVYDKVNPENFLKINEDNCQKLTFQISQIQLNKAKAEATIYNISDQDYRKCAELINIGKMTGIQCFVPVDSSETSLDRYFFFKCLECPNKKQFEGKIFGIKQYKKSDIEELETKETAIDNCLSTLIAQDVMNKFVSELQEKKANKILDFKFRDQFIIETTKDFKQVLQEQMKGQQFALQNEGIKNYIEFIESLDGDQSNEFYDFIREYSTDKNQPKDGNIIQAFLKVYNDQRLLDIYKKFNPDNIRKQFTYFIDFIGGNMKEMPQRLCYSIQEIEIKPEFQKYNGGHMKFDTSQEGKFLSAFTYYSIVKSQRQMCISHLQGVQNQLYDPLVSTYDGFLDKMDQGYNEIRTIESKFLSEANLNKGIEYMKALGIKWN